MSQKPAARDSAAGRAYLDIQRAARHAGRDTGEYLIFYALERFLVRLATSAYAADFVLKGGVLLAAYAQRRPTRDIDLRAGGFPNHVDEVAARIREIASAQRDDGVRFDPDSLESTSIRDKDSYTGVRVTLECTIHVAQIRFHLDVSFGDPLVPATTIVRLPLLLGGELRIKGYPIPLVLAEKVTTAIRLGTANTRWRDFVDIATLSRSNTIAGEDLDVALHRVAAHRGIPLHPLSGTLRAMAPIAQSKWAAWRTKQRLHETTPAAFQELIDQCSAFVDPVIEQGGHRLSWDGRSWRTASTE